VQKQSCCLLPRKPPIAEGETGSGRVGEGGAALVKEAALG